MGGTVAPISLRLHQDQWQTEDIPLTNSLTHNHPLQAGHTDVFEIRVPEKIASPDRLELVHQGKRNDGLDLKWIEIMNMKTLERKWSANRCCLRRAHITSLLVAVFLLTDGLTRAKPTGKRV